MISYRIYLNTIETNINHLFQVQKNQNKQFVHKITNFIAYFYNRDFMVLDTVCQLLWSGTRVVITILIVYALIAYTRRKIAKPNYKGKIVWITGASSGIGEYLAYEFNKHGAHVVLSARNVKELERVKQSCPNPEKAEVLPMDMTNYKEVKNITERYIKGLESNGQKIDVVVENAGLSMRCEFINYSFENHMSLFDVNVHGPFNHLQVLVPHFIKHKSGQIVGVTSLAGKLSTAYRSSYGGSKHAFIGILDSLRSELKPFGVRVCNLMPGYIKTNLAKNAFAGAAGEKFGKTDLNIQNGMDPAQFAKQSVGAIYNNQNEVSVSNDWLPVFGVILRSLCADLSFLMLARNAKVQQHAVDNAIPDKKE